MKNYFSSLLLGVGLLSSGLLLAQEEAKELFVVQAEESLSTHFEVCRKTVQEKAWNNADVMKQYDQLSDALKNQFLSFEGVKQEHVHRVLDAVAFASDKHSKQFRKDIARHPYIIHPLGVAYQLIVIGKVNDADVIIGALLHDTVEDTNTSFDEIKAQFGGHVEALVREVSDDKTLPVKERKRLQIVNAPHKSVGAAEIKLSDKLHNLKDLANSPPPDWDKGRIDTYFMWAKTVVDGLPKANAALKEAVDAVIEGYWQKQGLK